VCCISASTVHRVITTSGRQPGSIGPCCVNTNFLEIPPHRHQLAMSITIDECHTFAHMPLQLADTLVSSLSSFLIILSCSYLSNFTVNFGPIVHPYHYRDFTRLYGHQWLNTRTNSRNTLYFHCTTWISYRYDPYWSHRPRRCTPRSCTADQWYLVMCALTKLE
jgi:hypothetical protein